MRFDAVAFDLDGTLYPAAGLYAVAIPYMLGKARRLAAFNRTRRAIRAIGADAARRASGRPGAEAAGGGFRERQAAMTASLLNMSPSAAAAMIERDFYAGVQELFAKVRPFRGLEAALDRLAAGGLRLALLSDLPPARKLELMGLSGRFEPALCSEDSGFLKPAPEPFAMLVSALALPPARVLYVGNSPGIDLAGARRAGMAAAIVSPRKVPGADLSFWNWDRLADFALA